MSDRHESEWVPMFIQDKMDVAISALNDIRLCRSIPTDIVWREAFMDFIAKSADGLLHAKGIAVDLFDNDKCSKFEDPGYHPDDLDEVRTEARREQVESIQRAIRHLDNQ